jgi:tetratricopeptide (TPR) repeat protein
MNRFAWILLAVVGAASLMLAQAGGDAATNKPEAAASGRASNPAAKPSTAQAAPNPQSAQPPPAAPQQQAPPQTAPPQTAPQPQAPPALGRPQPQAKTEEEYKAYQDAMANGKPEEVEAAANQFASRFKESELRTLIYRRAMTMYQQTDKPDKVVEMGRKILAIDKDDPMALVVVAAVLSGRTRESDANRDQLWSEAERDAGHGLQTIDTNLALPPNISPEKAAEYKNMLRVMAYEALGMVAFSQNNFAAAEPNLRKATEIEAPDPDPYNFLRLAIVLDRLKKYPEAMNAANRALQLSPANSQSAKYAQEEKDRLAKSIGTEAGAAPAAH